VTADSVGLARVEATSAGLARVEATSVGFALTAATSRTATASVCVVRLWSSLASVWVARVTGAAAGFASAEHPTCLSVGFAATLASYVRGLAVTPTVVVLTAAGLEDCVPTFAVVVAVTAATSATITVAGWTSVTAIV